MAEIDKPKTRLETSTFTRFLDLKPIEKFDGLKFPTNGEVLRRYFYIKDHSSHSEVKKYCNNNLSLDWLDEPYTQLISEIWALR